MKVSDVMTRKVVTVAPETPLTEVARLMLSRHISAVPVVDAGRVVGIVSEGDLARRPELGTEAQRSPWVRLWYTRETLAEDFVKSHGRTAGQVMTPEVITVCENAPITEAVELMEKHHVKRLPVVRDDVIVGIISRADLVRALLLVSEMPGPTPGDQAIRMQIVGELKKQPWAPWASIEIAVVEGVVTLWGTVETTQQREAVRVLAENTSGARRVKNLITIAVPKAAPRAI